MKRQMGELSNLQFALLLTLPVLLFLVVIVAYPLLYALWISFHNIMFFGGVQETYVGLENYLRVWESREFWRSVRITFRFTIESVVLTMLIGLGMALILHRPFRGKGLLRSLVILPWAVSPYVAGILFKYFWSAQTGFPTFLAYLFGANRPVSPLTPNTVIELLAIGNAWHLAPLVAFFLLANLETIPQRLYHLAEIDHMNAWEKFWNVTLPALRFTLFVFTSVTTVLSLKEFDYIFTMTGGGPGTASATVTYQIYKESFQNLDLGYGAAMSFFLLALIIGSTLLLYLIWGRREERRQW